MNTTLLRRAVPAKRLLQKLPCAITNVPNRTKVGVYEIDRKSGYRKEEKPSNWTLVKTGLPMLSKELKLFKDEFKEKMYADQFLDLRHGDYEYAWKMNSKEQINEWIVTTDHDNSEGNSKASLDLTKNNMAMFHGYLSQDVPKDGVQKRAGYVSMRSPGHFKSFKRKVAHDWSLFNCLVMRVRGDGRSYLINIAMDRHFDTNWNDQYHYTLFTRGGPYWQVAKIPFSKFYVTSKGRIQDKQEAIYLDKVLNFGISVGDGNEGPFSLEIDYIALMYDENHYEKFAYELYETAPFTAGT